MEVAGGYVKQNGSCQGGGHGMAGQNYCVVDVELPRRKHTTYRTRRKFEIKNTVCLVVQIFFKTSILMSKVVPQIQW